MVGDSVPEPWRAVDTGDVGSVRDLAHLRRRELAGHERHLSVNRVVISRGTALRVCATLIVLLMLSMPLAGSSGFEPRARTTAILTTFTPPVMVNDDRSYDQAAPVIVATPDHKLIVVFQDMRSGNPDVYLSRSLDGGSTFGPNKRVDDSVGSSAQIEPAATVTAKGVVLVTWQDNRRGTFENDIYLTKSYDGGTTFTKNVKVDDSNGVISWQERPSITVTTSGAIYVAWTDDRTGHPRVRGAFSTDGGATFSPSEEISPSNGSSGQTGVSLACNGKRIFAAFTDNVTGTPHPYLCISTNGGQSFTAPIRLDNTGTRGVSQGGVSIAVMPGGGIFAAWEDPRNGNLDIYASIVSPHGTITTSNFRVDDDSTGAHQRGVSVAADQLGNVYAAWTDERGIVRHPLRVPGGRGNQIQCKHRGGQAKYQRYAEEGFNHHDGARSSVRGMAGRWCDLE